MDRDCGRCRVSSTTLILHNVSDGIGSNEVIIRGVKKRRIIDGDIGTI